MTLIEALRASRQWIGPKYMMRAVKRMSNAPFNSVEVVLQGTRRGFAPFLPYHQIEVRLFKNDGTVVHFQAENMAEIALVLPLQYGVNTQKDWQIQ